MTPVQQERLQKAVSIWIKARQKSLGITSGQLAELVGRRASTVQSYLSGKLSVPFDVILTLAYEDDCTVEKTQELFAAYANIRA
ncbi:helix-turn-helix transcriptional regulator [Acetobacteraceae bacterium B3987]|nr:helix-turn-helix transcriptional regulator [Acetobacteraceae bacterium B3987]